ncbi:hypothetical protein [Natronobacterium texcoconense]|uniref:Sec-independent protein translocase protein TatA n=1 Tax=Natronobacterium texcoconense TaxID=1095778 RepID=A0A1H1CP39_NATTX|nr:hypothetical protein [Natronobacterium texcoconense]SDQ65779.1 hypothetical protein SAMN04489842_1472 [Natronobacterium texcoconense]
MNTPLFIPGAPGGPELLIMLFILVLFLAVPIFIIAVGYVVLSGNRVDEQRVADLERRVERLEERDDRP